VEETHKGKSRKPSPILTKEKVNKSKLGNRLVKATAPNSQRKANNKTKKTQQDKSMAKSTCPKWHFGQVGHGGKKNHGGVF
jgi:hypothetical protein